MKIVTVILALLLLCGCAGPAQRKEPEKTTETNERTEESVNFDCDLLFLGDSITADSDFREYFPECSVVNLGVYGDTLLQILARVDAVRSANPAKIFLLGGINSLRPDNVDECLAQYARLLDALREACPEASICVQSVLPVGTELDPEGSLNDAVRRFNAGLEPLAREKGCDFADIYAAYEKDGAMDPALTRDGVHLNFTAYGPWAEVIQPYIGE